MHNVDIELVEMTLDVMKYAIHRITNESPELGAPRKEEELKSEVGELSLIHISEPTRLDLASRMPSYA